jgi:hypothetical protein
MVTEIRGLHTAIPRLTVLLTVVPVFLKVRVFSVGLRLMFTDQVAPLLYHKLRLLFESQSLRRPITSLLLFIYPHRHCHLRHTPPSSAPKNERTVPKFILCNSKNRTFNERQFRKKLLECARNIGADQSGPFLDNACKVLHTKTG